MELIGIIVTDVTVTSGDIEQSCIDLFDKGVLSPDANSLLRTAPIVSKKGDRFCLAIVQSSSFPDDQRTLSNIEAEAKKLGLSSPPIEVALYLLQEMLDVNTAQTLLNNGIAHLIIMHKPVALTYREPERKQVLCIAGDTSLYFALIAYNCDELTGKIRGDVGFVFLYPTK